MTQTEFGRIFTSVLDMGEIMLTSGAEVNRVEDTLQRMLKAYGCQRVDVFTILRGFIVVCGVDFGIENFLYWRKGKNT